MKTTRFAAVVAAVVALVCALALAGCAASAGGSKLTDADSGKTVELAVGAPLVIDLEENATTGYSWALQGSVPGALTVVGDEQKAAADTGVVGAAGRHTFEYKAAVAGQGELTLVYVRPWEKGVAPVKTFTVTVVVK
jgi:inhibitor of cysteine peptidase